MALTAEKKKQNAEIQEHVKVGELHKKLDAAHADHLKVHAEGEKHLADMAKLPHLKDQHMKHVASHDTHANLYKTQVAAHSGSAKCATVAECEKLHKDLVALTAEKKKHNAEMQAQLKLPPAPVKK